MEKEIEIKIQKNHIEKVTNAKIIFCGTNLELNFVGDLDELYKVFNNDLLKDSQDGKGNQYYTNTYVLKSKNND